MEMTTRISVPLEAKLEAIRRLDKGETAEKISAEYGVSEVTIGAWRINRDKLQEQYLSRIGAWRINRVKVKEHYLSRVGAWRINRVNEQNLSRRSSSHKVTWQSVKRYEYEGTSKALFCWFTKQRQKGNPVSWHNLRRKAVEIRDVLAEGKSNFNASSRWMEEWFLRYGINLTGGNSNTGSKETEVDTAASTSTSQSVVAVSNLSSLNENAGGISDSESEEDSNHSADILPLQEELLQDSTSQHTVLLSETASSVNSDTLILPSTSSSVVRDAEIPSSSHAVSSTAQSNSAIQLISSQQTNRGAKRPLEDREISPGLGNKQRRSGGEIAQENVFAATLDRLEDLSDKAIMLGSHDDDLDNFGKYVASLLRGLPSERATELQKEVIDLILKSHVKDEPDSSEVDPLALEEQLPPQSSSDTTQTTTVQRKNFEDIISASRQLVEKSRTPNVQQTNEVNGRSSGKLASSGQNADSTLLQRNNTDEKRLLPDESPANDETECDDPVLETKRVDAALKRLECISEKVNMLSEKDDNFDTFGKYVASLLRYISADKAVELQQELINLILKARANTKT